MNVNVSMSYVMIGLLLMLAMVCFTVPGADQWLPGNRKYIMGSVLIAYSVVRFFRLKKFIKMNAQNED